MSWWHLTEDELLSGETVIIEKMAGAFIKLKDYNLRSLSYLNWGGTDKEGGRLHLTNYRLIFASHALNRVVGKFSILLPTIQQIKNTSFLLDRRIEIHTQAQIFEFQVWGIPEFMARITSTRDRIDAKGKEALVAKITHEYPKLGEDFNVSQAMNMVAVGAVSLEHAFEKLTQGENPLSEMLRSESPPTSSSILNIVEFLGERVQEVEGTRKNEA
jgi:hypothetical protein